MFKDIDNLKLILISQGKVKSGGIVDGKRYNSFIIRTSGEVLYNFENYSMLIKTGDLLFLPKGSVYNYRSLAENSTYLSITFEADIDGAKPTVYSLESFTENEYFYSHIVNFWKMGTTSDKYKCYSLFYQLLSYLSAIDNVSYSEKKQFDAIEPAVVYLKKHIFDCSLKIDDLHVLCNMSDTYFRKIFVSKYGSSPQSYVSNKRLSYAKNLLESENTESVAEIAFSVGYSDPLYFSRIFKKKYGCAPTKI